MQMQTSRLVVVPLLIVAACTAKRDRTRARGGAPMP
jgi:ribosomal protein L22